MGPSAVYLALQDAESFTGRLVLKAPAPRKGIVRLLDFGHSSQSVAEIAALAPGKAKGLTLVNLEVAAWWDFGFGLAEKLAPPDDLDAIREGFKGVEEAEVEQTNDSFTRRTPFLARRSPQVRR